MNEIVYGLEDPLDSLYHYIGRTNDMYKRFIDHITGSGRNMDKNMWILERRKDNIMIFMRKIEDVKPEDNAEDREEFWIKYYLELGHPLTNIHISKSYLKELYKAEKTRQLEEAITRKRTLVEQATLAKEARKEAKVTMVQSAISDCLLQGIDGIRAISRHTGLSYNVVRPIYNDMLKESVLS